MYKPINTEVIIVVLLSMKIINSSKRKSQNGVVIQGAKQIKHKQIGWVICRYTIKPLVMDKQTDRQSDS